MFTRFISALVFVACSCIAPLAQALDFIVNGQFNPAVSKGYKVQNGDTFGGYPIFTNDGDWRIYYTQMGSSTGGAEALRLPAVGMERYDENGKWLMGQWVTLSLDYSGTNAVWTGEPCSSDKIVRISIPRGRVDRCAASEIKSMKLGGIDTEMLRITFTEANTGGRYYRSSFDIHFAQLGLTRSEVTDKSSEFNLRLKDWMGKFLDATVKAAGYDKPPDAFKGIQTFAEGTDISRIAKSITPTSPTAEDRARQGSETAEAELALCPGDYPNNWRNCQFIQSISRERVSWANVNGKGAVVGLIEYKPQGQSNQTTKYLGELEWGRGSVYYRQFVPNGNGTMYYPNGTKVQGRWLNGVFSQETLLPESLVEQFIAKVNRINRIEWIPEAIRIKVSQSAASSTATSANTYTYCSSTNRYYYGDVKLCPEHALREGISAGVDTQAAQKTVENTDPLVCQGASPARWNNCKGKWLNVNGDLYEGDWRDGKPNGHGIQTFASGEKYTGTWKDGKYEGQGMIAAANGTVISQGTWSANQLIRPAAPAAAQISEAQRLENERKVAQIEEERLRVVKERERLDAEKIQRQQAQQREQEEKLKIAETLRVENERKTAKLEEERLRLAKEREQLETDKLQREQAQLREQEEKLKLAQQEALAVQSGKRIALVMGNSKYIHRPLKNPINDADDISRALKAANFEVIDIREATLPQMRTAVRQFGDKLLQKDVGLVYYSGHGVEVKGKNYFIPVNADIQREDEIVDQSLDVSLILEKMTTAGKGVNILIVDACRDDPFGRSFRSTSQGLATMDAPTGTIIAYATSPGRVASDGDGRNSPYTKALVKAMQSPNKPIEQVFKEVRRSVREETKNQQTPWENTSLSGDFYFRVQK